MDRAKVCRSIAPSAQFDGGTDGTGTGTATHNIEKDLKGEDFVNAIRILIQATETAIWFQGHNIQIVSGFKIL